MALGEFRLFQMKSKEQREKEKNEYAVWAFPYGDLQRENLTDLMQGLDPKKPIQIFLVSYLTCKELYERTLEKSESREDATDKMLNEVKSYSQLISAKEMSLYLALVLADADVNEDCTYPSVNEIRERIQELEDMRKASKRKWF